MREDGKSLEDVAEEALHTVNTNCYSKKENDDDNDNAPPDDDNAPPDDDNAPPDDDNAPPALKERASSESYYPKVLKIILRDKANSKFIKEYRKAHGDDWKLKFKENLREHFKKRNYTPKGMERPPIAPVKPRFKRASAALKVAIETAIGQLLETQLENNKKENRSQHVLVRELLESTNVLVNQPNVLEELRGYDGEQLR